MQGKKVLVTIFFVSNDKTLLPIRNIRIMKSYLVGLIGFVDLPDLVIRIPIDSLPVSGSKS